MAEVYALLVVAAAIAALVWWKRGPLMRMFGAGRAQAGDAGRLAGQADAKALFQEAIDDGLARLRQAKEAMEGCRAMVKSVERQVESGEREKTRLESRIAAAMEQGDSNNMAKEYALQLAEVERQLAMNREQLAQYQQACDKFAQQIEIGQKRLMETRRRTEGLGIALEQSQRERVLAEFASSSNFEDVQARVAVGEELVYQEIDENRAAGRVAADLAEGIGPSGQEEAEREAEAGKILERFRKSSAS